MNRSVDQLRSELKPLLAQRETSLVRITQEKKSLKVAKLQFADCVSARAHIQQLAQEVQNIAHKQVARIVTKCLCAVFQEPYELRIIFTRKRGRTEAEFTYLKDGHKLSPHVTSGGVKEVVAMALRLTALVLTVPPCRRLLILDEPFSALSSGNIEKMGKMVEVLSAELGVQFIIVTHSEALQVGKVISI